ncbi:MAG: DNA internalization-related competence protein ComEC/Rec2 [Lachnospiraceae bacterium]|nr:DNA internalization-related competence protein ComEC/Rec2 [Lachnospiraceae bacterium]
MKRPLCVACMAVIFFTALGLWLHPPEYLSYGEASGGRVVVTGRVCAKEFKGGKEAPVLLIYLEPDSLTFQNIPIPFEEQILCTMESGAFEPAIGARIKLEGILMENEPALNPGGFDARLYYKTIGVSARLLSAKILAVSGEKEVWKEGLWQCKKWLCEALQSVLDREDAAIVKTMLLGDKSDLEKDIKKLYREAGILHLLSISGLHISLIGMGLYRLFKKSGMPLTAAAFLSGALLLFYGEMIGMPVSAYRAVFMFLLRLLADVLGRTYDGLTALSLSGTLLVLKQPLYLMHAGFLLSFLSVLAVLLFKPALRLPKLKLPALEEGLAASLSIGLFTLPVQLYFYYEISIYGPFFNLLVLPLAGAVLIFGLGTMALALFSARLAWPIALLLHGILTFYGKGSLMIGNLPWHLFTPGQPKGWQIGIFYALILLLLGFPKLRFRFQAGLLCGAVLILCIHIRTGLTVTVLDVGQGECICLELPGGENYLIDGGSTSVSQVGDYRIEPFLKSQGITALDAVFLSHGDSDHVSGIIWLLEKSDIDINTLVLPTVTGSGADSFAQIRELAEKKAIPILSMSAGMSWQSGEVMLACLHPQKGFMPENDNAGSQVLYLTYGEFSMLFTGDTEGNGEDALLNTLQKYGIEDLTVLKVAHHGSAGSTGEELLQQLSPDIAVLSYGKNNPYGHPHAELMGRLSQNGCRIFGTGGSGAVSFYTDGRVLKQN